MKLTEAQNICIKIMMAFEGTGYTGLAGSFDGVGFTYGICGWNFGTGTLQPLIKAMHEANETAFKECCTVYVPIYKKTMDLSDSLLAAASLSPAEAIKWAVDRQTALRPHQQWRDVFTRLGNQKEFRDIQNKFAHKRFKTALSYCEEYNLYTVRGLMLFFDCSVQQGSIKTATKQNIDRRTTREMNSGIKMYIIAEEMANQANPRWQTDVLTRRICIVNGRGTVHGRKYNLDGDYGLTDENIV